VKVLGKSAKAVAPFKGPQKMLESGSMPDDSTGRRADRPETPESKAAKKRRIWKHRLRPTESVSITVVTRHGRPVLEVIISTDLPGLE
jgi:hypothetical protein